MNIPGLFPLGWTGLIYLLSTELSRVFSSTTVWKYQFFCTQPSLWSNSHICTWLHYSFLDQYSCKFCVLWLVDMSLKSPICRFLLHFSSHCPLPLCLVACCLRNGVVYPEFFWLQLLDVQYVLLFFSFPVNWLLNVKAWCVLFINLFAKIDLYVVLYTTKERSWNTIYIHFHICSVVFSIFILKLKVV